MRTAYHYTSDENFEKILEDKVLNPESSLVNVSSCWKEECSGLVVPKRNYTFAFLDTPKPISWVKTGFLDSLLEEYIKPKPLVLLSFEISEKENIFVLESKPLYELWDEKKDAKQAFEEYIKSKIRLSKYDDSYEMPELAIGEKIHLNRINLEYLLDYD